MKTIDSPIAVEDYTGIPASTLAQWRYRGDGPRYIKTGRLVRYKKEDIDAWLENNTVGTKDQPVLA